MDLCKNWAGWDWLENVNINVWLGEQEKQKLQDGTGKHHFAGQLL